MAHYTENSLKVNIPAEQLWKVLADYSSVEKFALTIKSSPVIGDISSGVGAKRRCTFNDGSSLVEEITHFEEGNGFTMEISEHSLPLKSMTASMKVSKIDESTSELHMSASFVVKGGTLGWLLGALVMRPVMKGVFKKLMTGLAYYSKTGKAIEAKLPEQTELSGLLAN